MGGDRYPIPGDQKWLAEKLAQLEREIEQLKAARPMLATTQQGGAFRLASDPSGARILDFAGVTSPDGNEVYGVTVWDTIEDDGDQAIVLAAYDNSRGLVFPFDTRAWVIPTSVSLASVGTWVSLAEAKVVWPNADMLRAEGAVIVPVGSTAEVRLRDSTYGDVTDVVTVPSGGNGTVYFRWLHPWSVGWGDATHPHNTPFLHWEVRLASGAGPVVAYPPRYLMFQDHQFWPSAANTHGGGAFG